MSRQNRSPFHKPTPFEFPRVPLSPPETNTEVIGPAHLLSSNSHLGQELRPGENEPSPAHSAHTPESAGSRFRKISSIAYHTSGLKESRERAQQRARAFVIVIPPLSFAQDHGQLGHTLSSGPRHRLSQGLLMPLFPTMYGQLTAIAREFNFPSTTGLCLYPQFEVNGVSMTPRISDETWPLVWNHVFETTTVPKSPISGKIEFDLDMRLARWYASWIASSHRDFVDLPLSVNPSATPSVTHERADSKTTFQDEDQEDGHIIARASRHVPRKLSLVDRYDMTSTRSTSRPASRSALSPPEHVRTASQILSPIFQEEEPKSARHDLDSRVKSWRASANLNPTSLAATGQTSLEPANLPNSLIIDDALLDTPGEELNLEDFAWSVSSAGPPDYDPWSPVSFDRVPSVHMADRVEGSVCLTPSDCTSFGPSDYTLPSPRPSIYRLPSPDVAHRMYEDLPPTPSTATSWGAPLEYPSSPVGFSRARSVDLGHRAVISRPPTPSTATSWGPSSWLGSPMVSDSEYQAHSVHLGDRGDFSRPVTPSTATSWGAPLSYPPSPVTPFYISTPDAGHRGFEDSDIALVVRPRAPWGHSWPYNIASFSKSLSSTSASALRASSRAPWGLSWPYIIRYTSTTKSRDPASPGQLHTTYSRHSPCSEAQRALPWALSWPYRSTRKVINISPVHRPSAYPRLVIYESVYPHFDLYPAVVLDQNVFTGYPSFDLYPALPLIVMLQNSVLQPVVVRLTPCYPVFNIYPPIYPGNVYDIYPLVSVDDAPANCVKVDAKYPYFDLYPSVYPYVTPYPQMLEMGGFNPVSTQCIPGYPNFDLYPDLEVPSSLFVTLYQYSGYPEFNLYPAIETFSSLNKEIAFKLPLTAFHIETTYPHFNLYPAVYPHFNLYPTIDNNRPSGALSLLQYTNLDLPVTTLSHPSALPTRLTAYPVFDLYPAIYPEFDIYLPVERTSKTSSPVPAPLQLSALSTRLTVYPVFDIYPAIYPAFNIYPPVQRATVTIPPALTPASQLYPLSTRLAAYPVFDLYPAAYPAFNLYPLVERITATNLPIPAPWQPSALSTRLTAYPVFDLYPAIYPAFDLYPLVERRTTGDENVYYPQFNLYPVLSDKRAVAPKPLSVRASCLYPVFDLYPAVYPHIEVYLSLPWKSSNVTESKSEYNPKFNGLVNYPTFNLYPAVYPYFDLYPLLVDNSATSLVQWGDANIGSITVKVQAQYPAFDLYPAVYPHFNLWPRVDLPQMAPLRKPSGRSEIHSRLTHSELHAMVMMERIGYTGSFGSFKPVTNRPSKVTKSHSDLHRAVFPAGIQVQTPSGTCDGNNRDFWSHPDELMARRSPVSALRSSNARVPLPGSPRPNRHHQPPPSHGTRLSSAFESIPILDFGDEIAAPTASPRQRAPASKFPQDVEPGYQPGLNRPTSLMRPLGAVPQLNGIPTRSSSLSGGSRVTGSARRRDSIVSQRVRAYNPPQDSTYVLRETLPKFPAPPIPLPRTPVLKPVSQTHPFTR